MGYVELSVLVHVETLMLTRQGQRFMAPPVQRILHPVD